jgi:type II secretion system (T2SS) protein G
MKRILAVAAVFVFAVNAYVPNDAERARWTMHDMQSWRIVFDAYYTDHKEYPAVATLDEARAIGEPLYIRHAPMTDAWGNAYRIQSNAKGYRIVSAGADGVFQSDTSATGSLSSFNDDAVAANGNRWLVRYWEMK